MYSPKTCQCACNNHSRSQTCCIANSLARTDAWYYTIRSHHGTSATPTSIRIESVRGSPVISIQSKWDFSRSVDTVRVGLPIDFDTAVICTTGTSISPLPKLQWTYFLPQWRYLCIKQRHTNARATTFCGCEIVALPIWSHRYRHHNNTARNALCNSAAPSSILIYSVLIPSVISS